MTFRTTQCVFILTCTPPYTCDSGNGSRGHETKTTNCPRTVSKIVGNFSCKSSFDMKLVTRLKTMKMFTKIGLIGSTAAVSGVLLIFLGMLMQLGVWLLVIGNVILIGGLVYANGHEKTLQLFFAEDKRIATVFFLVGIACMLFGKTLSGALLEICGLILLFENIVMDIINTIIYLAKVIGALVLLFLMVIVYLLSTLFKYIFKVHKLMIVETHSYTYVNGILVNYTYNQSTQIT
ncbi:uncharacterized protein LOC143918636 [Arctopsyche grandis]|uniref:uncharacterized protein LOC143918636 n=1 Tax=Arctopsyche grandis TaxID=121162 RepID=UPI00406D66D5